MPYEEKSDQNKKDPAQKDTILEKETQYPEDLKGELILNDEIEILKSFEGLKMEEQHLKFFKELLEDLSDPKLEKEDKVHTLVMMVKLKRSADIFEKRK